MLFNTQSYNSGMKFKSLDIAKKLNKIKIDQYCIKEIRGRQTGNRVKNNSIKQRENKNEDDDFEELESEEVKLERPQVWN